MLVIVEFLVSKLTYINIMEDETKVDGVEVETPEVEETPATDMPAEEATQ